MVALNILLNRPMHISNRGHPIKAYHNTVNLHFNYEHLIIADSLLCPLGKKSLTFSLNSTRLIRAPSTCMPHPPVSILTRFDCNDNNNNNKLYKNALYLSVNVFSEEVLIKDTIFMSPTADGTALAFYVTRSSEPRQGLAITRAKEVPYLPVILGP